MMMATLAWVNHPRTEQVTMGVILLNAAILVAETMTTGAVLAALKVADKVCLAYFMLEIVLRLSAAALGPAGVGVGLRKFLSQGWNIFDILATLAGLIPGLGALRTLRLLRLVARIPAFRDTVEDLLHACARSVALLAMTILLLFLGALTGTLAFQAQLPELFGTLAQGFITAFGMMLGDNVAANIGLMWGLNVPLAIFFMAYTAMMSILVLSLVVSIVIEVAQARQKMRGE